ncbi:MAG TPA: peptidoglycan DD-metalloendopeptidase family protein [Candidatus Binatia bacterium]
MERFKRAHLACLVALAALPVLVGAAAVDRDLEGIKKKIEKEKKGLSRLEDRESSVLDSLEKIQTELDKRTREIKLANSKLSVIARDLAAKQAEAERIADSIAARLELLRQRAAALYRWQRTGTPLVVLNGNVSLSRLMQRQRYLQAALSFDRELLAKLEDENRRQAELRDELAEKREELAEQKQSLGAAKQAIRKEAQKKQTLLTSVRREKQTRLRALREMQAAAQRLEKMMEEIARRALVKPRQLPSGPPPGSGLAALRGRLEWPVRGRVSAPFGKFRHPEFSAEIVRKGIDIDAPEGGEIKAVEKGRVVYAERFSGYGNMVILDHGERYYTIYGHLAEIVKKNGESVTRGEVLGRAGESDSLAGAKLYFEIRKDGHSLDPLPWLRNR